MSSASESAENIEEYWSQISDALQLKERIDLVFALQLSKQQVELLRPPYNNVYFQRQYFPVYIHKYVILIGW